MTEEEKRKIRDNAWSLPPDQEPAGKLLFSETRGDDTYHYYECDEEGEYRYDTEKYRTHRLIEKDKARRKTAERKRRPA